MKYKKVIGTACLLGLLFSLDASAQVTTLGNNVTIPAEYVGCDAFSTQPLRFSTLANFAHQWRTNNVLRMRLHETLTAQAIGSYTNENLSGNLGIGLFNTANVTRPFTLLRVDNGGNQFSGYRPWHRPGLTITNGTDLGWAFRLSTLMCLPRSGPELSPG